jgi:thiamine biosynthesis lipoprotein
VIVLACLWSFALAAPLAPGSGVARNAVVERARYLMGTLCTVTAAGADSAAGDAAVAAAFEEIARLESVMSSWREDSELSRFNLSAGNGPQTCSAELGAVLDSALEVARMTDGAFDPTIDPLIRAWDLRGEGRLPSPADLAAARDRVGWQQLARDRNGRTAFLPRPGMGVDLGGIGKGFALDRAAAILAHHGMTRVVINFGGELLVRGRESVEVADPLRRLTPAVEIAVADMAVSTSGQSERGFTSAGVRYGHILDPRTGRPVATAASVTVVCSSATRADGLSTALLVMGRQRAAQFAGAHPGVGVLWLEPGAGGIRGWRWNLPAAQAVPGATVQWMERSDVPN